MPGRINAAQRTQANPQVPAVDLSVAILEAMKAVRQNPTDATVNAQARELANALAASGVGDRGWERHLLLNFKKTVTGEDPNALGYLKGNLQRASQVMTRGAVNQALALGQAAQRNVVNTSGVSVKDAQAYMGQLLSRSYTVTDRGVTNLMGQLRNAGFTDAAMKTGVELYRTFQATLKPYTSTGVQGLQRDLSRLETLLPLAAKQGVIDQATFRSLSAKVAQWKGEFRPKTADEVSAANLQRVRDNAPLMQRAQSLLGESKEIRAYIDGKGGWTSAGLGTATVLQKLVGKLENTKGALGGAAGVLQRALALPDSDATKVDKVKAATARVDALIKELRPKGANTVAHLNAQREAGFDTLGRASSAAGFIPVIGKPLAVALKGTEAGLRYMSGDWTATEAAAKTLLAVVDARFGDAIVGKGSLASQGVRAFLSKALQGTLGDVIGIMGKDLPADQRAKAINTAIASNLSKAFVDAVGKITSGAIKIGSPAEAQEVYKFLHSVADKLGIQQLVHKPLKDLKDAYKL